jgi:hypothetical protein
MNITNYGDSGPRVLQQGDPGSSQLRPGDIIADRELYLTKDDRIVERKDKDALFLLIAPGQVLTREKAEQFSLRVEDGRLAWGPVVEAPAVPAAKPADVEPEAGTEVAPEVRVDLANGITEAKSPDLSGLTKAELQAQLTERGIEFADRATKADLIAALAAAE